MNIDLKLTPLFNSDNYHLDQNCLKIPALFSYEDSNKNFVFNVTSGLNIIGKLHPETNYIMYFIGETCTVETLNMFISSLLKNLPCSIVFGEDSETVNFIEYDPVSSTWKHKTDSQESHAGGTLTLKVTSETLRKFIQTLETFRRFACMQIEGHKRLWEMEQQTTVNMDTVFTSNF